MLNIILFSRKQGKVLNLQCNHWSHLLIPAVAVVMVLGLLLGLGYYLGTHHGHSSIMAKWKRDLTRQQHEMVNLKARHQENLDALAQRTAMLQAQMNRIDALGVKLISMAGLEAGEFDFGNPPGVGGPSVAAHSESTDKALLESSLKNLEDDIDDRQKQLEVLDQLLLSEGLHQRVHPQGRPIEQGWLSSSYGRRTDPFTGKPEFHNGIDFAGKSGDKVIAVAGGVVTRVTRQSGYGNLIEIDHGNGYQTRYGHNKEALVKAGQAVSRGQTIGLMGSTGRSTGPHVHFEVIQDGRRINPINFIRASR